MGRHTGCEGRTSTVSADEHVLCFQECRRQMHGVIGRRWTVHQRRQNEGIHEAVEVVEKLLQRELGHRQELSREGRLCAIHQLGGRNAIGLRVVGSCHHVLDAQGATEGRPR